MTAWEGVPNTMVEDHDYEWQHEFIQSGNDPRLSLKHIHCVCCQASESWMFDFCRFEGVDDGFDRTGKTNDGEQKKMGA